MEQFRQDVAEGRIEPDRLVELIASQQKTIHQLQQQIEQQQAQIEQLKAQLDKNPTERLDEAYSEKAEDKRKADADGKTKKTKKSKKAGRRLTALKIAQAERTEQVFPNGCRVDECKFSHTRVAWRLEGGRAILVAYEIYRCGNTYGQPTGVPGRGEFGIEILIALAYQVYTLGLSLDKACQVLGFFQGLSLSKSQANSLLNQLSRAWESEFDTLCKLLANSAIVHCDETSWSINSVWAFLTESLTVMFYGVHKDGATLQQILDKATFNGLLISDNAPIYQGFSTAQKCWAHLIRKAIKLTLQAPENKTYREFADGLLAIYRRAKRVVADRRFSDAGRRRRVAELDDEVLELCGPRWLDDERQMEGPQGDFRRLNNEIMELMLKRELFVFVTTQGAIGNNNPSE
ncbi:MAG: transposase, partial [Planctomycetota bacterium]|nr:transposase [Planctomycetota bacterium]